MNLLNFASQISSVEAIIGGFILLITGGVASYFLIKYQVSKNLQTTIQVYKEEVEALTGKVLRLQGDVDEYKAENDRLRGENHTLKFKKNYLKDLLIQAATSKKSIDKVMIDAMLQNQK